MICVTRIENYELKKIIPMRPCLLNRPAAQREIQEAQTTSYKKTNYIRPRRNGSRVYDNKSQSNQIKLLSLSFLSSVLFVSFVFLLSYGTLINLVGTGLKLERQQCERGKGG